MTDTPRGRRRFVASMFVALGLSARPARSLADATRRIASPWVGLGNTTMHFAGYEARITYFDNDELLAERIDFEADVVQRYFRAQPSDTELYSSLPIDRAASDADNPFSFFDMAFAIPLGALDRAYPEGPASVPADSVRRIVFMDGSLVALETKRTQADSLSYTVDGFMGSLTGEIRAARQPAWADDLPFAEWTTASFESFPTLRLARTTPLRLPLTRFFDRKPRPR